jgi:hypothetical protein
MSQKPGRKCLSRAQMAEPYELSQDLLDKQQEVLSNRYGGQAVANQAANTIQRAYRRYSMGKKFAAITSAASTKSENRLSRRFASMSQQQQQQQQQMMMTVSGTDGIMLVHHHQHQQQQYHHHGAQHQQKVGNGGGELVQQQRQHHYHHHYHQQQQFFVDRSRPPDCVAESFHHNCCVYSSNSKTSYAGKHGTLVLRCRCFNTRSRYYFLCEPCFFFF